MISLRSSHLQCFLFVFLPLLGRCRRHSVLGCPVSIRASVRGRKKSLAAQNLWTFHRIYNFEELQTNELIRFQGQSLRSQWDHIWSNKRFGRHFVTCLLKCVDIFLFLMHLITVMNYQVQLTLMIFSRSSVQRSRSRTFSEKSTFQAECKCECKQSFVLRPLQYK